MQNYSILLVDDDPIILNATGRDFENRGYRVSTADSGEKAFELLSKDTFDLVITDLHMEPIDGIDVLKKSKEINPDVMVMILTGYGDMASAIDTFRLGADDYLAKPCSTEEIQYRVEKCLENLENKKKIKHAEMALRESEEKYRNLVETAYDVIWEVDTNWIYTYISPNVSNVLGYRPEELLGKSIYEIISPNEFKQLNNIRLEKRNFSEPVSVEVTIFHKDGYSLVVESNSKPIIDADGVLIGYRGVGRDITEKRILEAEALRVGHLAALGELAAGVAHEINNPINGVINYAEILKDEFEEQGQDADIPNRIIKEGERIAKIVRNLLSFAKDRKEIHGPVHIKDILTDALGLVEKQTTNDGIMLSIEDLSDLPNIEARPQEIQQVFLNIFSNARYALNQKFLGSHIDKVFEVSGESIEIKGRDYVRMTFYDRGTGIPGEILDKICNPFFSTKPKDKGTGLGLNISHGIVKNHGGRLWFESVEGEYTKVFIDLPVWKKTETES